VKDVPYNSAQATKRITVQAVSVALSVTPSPPWTAGDSITLTATVLKDGSAWAGATVNFRMYFNAKSSIIGSKTTGSDGKASLTYTLPWSADGVTIPCKTIGFDAYEVSTATASKLVTGNVAYPTRISISAPSTVSPGEPFIISGTLEYQSASGVWSGLAGKTVSLYYNSTKIADVTTASDGSYSKTGVTITTPGTYTLKASFAGAGFTAAFLGLTVSPETKAALQVALPLLTGAIVAFSALKVKR
jgi:hypothetical protein